MKKAKASRYFAISSLSIFVLFAGIYVNAQNKPTKGGVSSLSKDTGNALLIHQEVDFKLTPQQLYNTLLDSKEFSACTKNSFPTFSDNSATIDAKVGGTFSVFDGHIVGRILELVPNQRIVEAWRVVDWPAGIYSIAKFEIKAQGFDTKIVFDHIGFPDGLKQHLAEGWQQHYWDALRNYFKKK